MKGMNTIAVATILVAVLAAIQIRSERYDHRCGPSYECAKCDPGRCCSKLGYCGSTKEYCYSGFCESDCPFNTAPCQPKGCECIQAHHDITYGWDLLKAARATCPSYSANISLHGMELQSAHHLFCQKQGESNVTNDHHTCGQCLKVRRHEAGTQTIVRLPTGQECNNNDLNLGRKIFEELNTDGEGSNQDYLRVNYQVVHCDED